MVITFDNSTSAIAAYEQLQGRVYEDKKLMGKLKKIRAIKRPFYVSRQIINYFLCRIKKSYSFYLLHQFEFLITFSLFV